MTRPLTGAALNAQRRKHLIDEARDAMTDRTPTTPAHIEALLVRAEAKRPTRNPEPLRPEIAAALFDQRAAEEYEHGLTLGMTPDERLAFHRKAGENAPVVVRFTAHSQALPAYPADLPRTLHGMRL